MATTVAAALAMAKAHEAGGDWPAARALYEAVLAADAGHPVASWRLAEHDLAQGRADIAVQRLEPALPVVAAHPALARELWFALARARMARGEPAAAAMAFGQMHTVAPDDPVAGLGLASAALAAGDAQGAERAARAALARHPQLSGGYANLAIALSMQRRFAEAFPAAVEAVRLAPASVSAVQLLSAVALEAGRAAEALPLCRAAHARATDNPALAAALADVLKGQGDAAGADAVIAPFMRAPAPSAAILVSAGALLVDTGRFAQAVDVLERAVAAQPSNPRAWDNLGTACARTGRPERAAEAFAQAVRLDPRVTPTFHNLVHALRVLCAWDALAPLEAALPARRAAPDGDPRWNPFFALRDDVTPQEQLRIARAWSAATLPTPIGAPAFVRSPGTRLRIGYLSTDLHDHATARLMAGLFERHDRARTEIFAYSCGPDDGSAMRQRVRAAFDHWRELGVASDADAARAIAADQLDILVDLKGHTQGNRLGIVARRPAPVQVHYLGFPGTLGCAAIDALVADATVVPPGEEGDYHEAIVRLPRCYQVNDDRRALLPAPPRHALHLPDDALVLASFNQSYKLSRAYLALWADALRAAPSAVLWLFAHDAAAQANLRREAEALGVPAARVVFAPAVGADAHLARLQAADLALDVQPCGAHTTGSDALWAGVPLLTRRGTTFAGRVGASLVEAVGLPELVAASDDEYCAKLALLLREPERLRAHREHLRTTRAGSPLFDTAGFTRDFERVLESLAGGAANGAIAPRS